MSSYRPIDSKREEFRKYLERAGVMDALTKVLVSLYEEVEKPDNALEYVRSHLGGNADSKDVETLREELEASHAKIQALEEENAVLKEKLTQFIPAEEGAAGPDDREGASSLEEAESDEAEEAPPEEESNE